MRRIILFATIAAVALATAVGTGGCQNGGSSASIGAGTSGLVGEEEMTGTDAGTTEASMSAPAELEYGSTGSGPEDESVVDDLVVTWSDAGDDGPVAKLVLNVLNATDGEISFETTLLAEGVVGEGERKLGKRKLIAGESVEFKITAASLPVRSVFAVTRLLVRISRTKEGTPFTWYGKGISPK